MRLFANRNRSSSYVARLLLVAGMMGMFYFLTLFLRGVLGYSDLVTGFAFLPLTLVVFASSQLSARVFVERFGPHRVMIVGISLSVLGMLSLTQLDAASPYWQLLVSLVVFGLGNGTAFVPLTTAALDGVAPQDAGAASGLVNVMQQVGGALGLAVLVTVFGAARSGADVSGLDPADGGAAGVRRRRPARVLDRHRVPGRDLAARGVRDPSDRPRPAARRGRVGRPRSTTGWRADSLD